MDEKLEEKYPKIHLLHAGTQPLAPRLLLGQLGAGAEGLNRNRAFCDKINLQLWGP